MNRLFCLVLFSFNLLSFLNADNKNPSISSQPVPYDADLFNKDKSVYFVEAEFLYWLANNGCVDYAVKMDEPAWSDTLPTGAIGNYHSAQFDWSPGFRVSFGHFNAPHYWDVTAQYTYVPASGAKHVRAPKESDAFLNGTWTQPSVGTGTPPPPLQKASSHIELDYNVLDFLFARRFQTNEHLRLNVYGGLTSALIFQKWKISYEDTAKQHSYIYNRFRFEGVGLRLGVKMDWFLGWDLYLTGGASTGIVSGWYKNSVYQKTSAVVVGGDNSRPIRNTQFHDNRLTYTMQSLLGISWQKRFTNVRAEIFAGYEFNMWTNLQQIYRSELSVPTAAKGTIINSSDLSLQGLTIRAGVDF